MVQCPQTGLACVRQECDPATGLCTLTPAPDPSDCDDSDPCTIDDHCVTDEQDYKPTTASKGESASGAGPSGSSRKLRASPS